MLFLFSLAVVAGLAWYMMEPAERQQVLRWAVRRTDAFLCLLLRRRRTPEPLDDVLRARTRRALVTAGLVAANVAVFLGLLFGSRPIDDPAALLEWGASIGTRTANGEWWRLATSAFVHAGPLALAVNMAALLSLGRVLERLVGPLAFASVYLAASVMGAAASLTSSSIGIFSGASAAVFGLYGLLIAAWMWGAWQGATTTIRVSTVAKLAPPAAVFVVYHQWDHGVLGSVEQIGVVTGFISGLVLARRAAEGSTPAPKIAGPVAVTACLAMMAVVPLRGVVDLQPTLQELVVMEERQSTTYRQAAEHVSRGRAPRASLIEVIERSLLPEVEVTRRRISALDKVPHEQRVLLAAAQTFLQRREEAWRLRVRALRQSSMPLLKEADALERSARDALQRATG